MTFAIARLVSPCVFLVLSACGWEPTYPANAADAYRQWCASCHGLEGRGDGPAATAMSPRPTDLTTSTLSEAELMKVIDGRRTLRAHGDASMPVWGHVFEQVREGDSRQHRDALRQVQGLAEYVIALRARAR